jgi:hypothetical protein
MAQHFDNHDDPATSTTTFNIIAAIIDHKSSMQSSSSPTSATPGGNTLEDDGSHVALARRLHRMKRRLLLRAVAAGVENPSLSATATATATSRDIMITEFSPLKKITSVNNNNNKSQTPALVFRHMTSTRTLKEDMDVEADDEDATKSSITTTATTKRIVRYHFPAVVNKNMTQNDYWSSVVVTASPNSVSISPPSSHLLDASSLLFSLPLLGSEDEEASMMPTAESSTSLSCLNYRLEEQESPPASSLMMDDTTTTTTNNIAWMSSSSSTSTLCE